MEETSESQILREHRSMGFFSFGDDNKAGWLTKQGGRIKTWRRRWFVLQDNRMYYYRSQKDPVPQGFIPLEHCHMRLVHTNNKKHCFEIFDPKQPFSKTHPSFFVYADSEAEMQQWMKRLRTLGQKPYNIAQSEVIQSGWLVKQGGIVKNWKMRWFVLKGNYLWYYAQTHHTQPLGCIPINRANVAMLDDSLYRRSFCFEITDPSGFTRRHRSYVLSAPTSTAQMQWIKAISRVKTSACNADSQSPIIISPSRPDDELKTPPSSPPKNSTRIQLEAQVENQVEDSPNVQLETRERFKTDGTFFGIGRKSGVDLPRAILKLIDMLDGRGLNTGWFPHLSEVDDNKVENLRISIERSEGDVLKSLIRASDDILSLCLLITLLSALFLRKPQNEDSILYSDFPRDSEGNSNEVFPEFPESGEEVPREIPKRNSVENSKKDEVRQPLLTFDLSERLIQAYSSENSRNRQLRNLKEILDKLPSKIYNVLEYLLGFFGRIIDRSNLLSSDFKLNVQLEEEDAEVDEMLQILADSFAKFLIRPSPSQKLEMMEGRVRSIRSRSRVGIDELDEVLDRLENIQLESQDLNLKVENSGEFQDWLAGRNQEEENKNIFKLKISQEIFKTMIKEFDFLFMSFEDPR
eukprot:TRINITY_DN3150_c5_g1_i1.p1 TRINITY_DN3150_c5_g1~~TRINITY_DN3150_c5_g1_i1.p1  ORF type:complete len:634 (-),score=234.50 TRINITY_DN3150_c5_g1_i1:44-1945(-)